eukprot:7637592-Heterocapsa_arctica.AAC.1
MQTAWTQQRDARAPVAWLRADARAAQSRFRQQNSGWPKALWQSCRCHRPRRGEPHAATSPMPPAHWCWAG